MRDELSSEGNLRRVRRVRARQVRLEEAELIWTTAAPRPARPPALGEEDDWGEMPLVVDPIEFGRRHRKRSHAWWYRLARVVTLMSLMCTVAGIITMALGDRMIGRTLTGGALLCGVLGMLISMQSKLSGRVLAYAVAAGMLAAMGVGAALLAPARWF